MEDDEVEDGDVKGEEEDDVDNDDVEEEEEDDDTEEEEGGGGGGEPISGPRRTVCASLLSRNAPGDVTRAALYGN